MEKTFGVPEKRFSTGVVNATIWKNNTVDNHGNSVTYRTVSFERRYSDPQGNWKSTSSLRIRDLPRASLVLEKAFEYLSLREKEDDLCIEVV